MWPNSQFPADLVTFTEEILNGKLHFLSSDCQKILRETFLIRKLTDYKYDTVLTQSVFSCPKSTMKPPVRVKSVVS